MTDSSILARREAQMFPSLSAADMARARRFGSPVALGDGDSLFAAGQAAPGLFVIERAGCGSPSATVSAAPP